MKEQPGDIQRLKEKPNNILNAYSLNPVQLNLRRQHTQDYYRDLREHLAYHKESWPDLNDLCWLSDIEIQPDPGDNRLAVPYYTIGRNM